MSTAHIEVMLEAMRFPGMRDLMLLTAQEALEDGLTRGYEVLPIFGSKPEDVSDRGNLVENLLDALMLGSFCLRLRSQCFKIGRRAGAVR
jgi:hypothetical protein